MSAANPSLGAKPKAGTPYHAFLSHNGADKPLVEQVAEQLEKQGIACWLDKWNLVPGEPWQPALEHALGQCATCVVFFGPHGLGPWHNEEMRLALQRRVNSPDQKLRVLPVILPGGERAKESELPGFLQGTTWVEFRRSLDDEEAFHRLACGIKGIAPGRRRGVTLLEGECPYLGLKTFQPEHAGLFFGRVAKIQELLYRLGHGFGTPKEERFLMLIGASGSGKSSLALAGLIPALRRGELSESAQWPLVCCRPDARPWESLQIALAHDPQIAAHLAALPFLITRPEDESRRLHLTAQLALHGRPQTDRLVVFIDQFEEVFTLCHDETARRQLIDNVLYATSVSAGRTIVVLTMRADFYGQCARYAGLRAALSDHPLLIGPLREEELREAIEAPAQLAGGELEPGLLELLLADMKGQAGALPFLEHALFKLWEQREGRRLTAKAYLDMGRLGGALDAHAEEFFTKTLTSQEQLLCRQLLVDLVHPGEGAADTKKRVSVDDVAISEAARAVLQKLADARLVTTDREARPEAAQAELAHEALIGGWRRLGQWINENREKSRLKERLLDGAGEWQRNGRREDFLYRGAQLALAEERFASSGESLPKLGRTFLEASIVKRNREREEKKRRLALILAAVALAVIVLALFSTFAWWQWQEAERNRAFAEDKAKQEEIARNDAERQLYLNNVSEASRELAANNITHVEQLLNEAPRDQRQWEWFYLKNLLTRSGLLTFTDSPELVQGLAFSPDHKTLLIARASGLTLLETVKGKPIQTFDASKGHTGKITAATFTGDGKQVISGDSDGTLAFWDTAKAGVARTIRAHAGAITCIALSSDGARIATAGKDQRVKIWDLTSGRELLTLSGHTAAVSCVAFSPDNASLASGSKMPDSTVKVWSLTTGAETLTLMGHKPVDVTCIAFSPDGQKLVSAGGVGSEIRVWDTKTGQMVDEVTGHSAAVVAVAFSPSGEYLFSASNDQTVRAWAWSAKPGRKASTFRGHTTGITSMALSADGAYLATASLDGIVKIWDATHAPEAITIGPGEGLKYTAMAFSPDGERIVAAVGPNNTLRSINAITGREEGAWPAGPDKVVSVAFSPDGKRTASLSGNGTVKLWEAGFAREVASFSAGDASTSIAFSRDGATVVCAGGGGAVRVFDVASGKERLQFRSSHVSLPGIRPDFNRIGAVGLSADGARFASAGSVDSQIKVWDTQKGELIRVFGGPVGSLANSAAFSRDGRFLAVSTSTGPEGPSVVSLWDIEKNKQLSTFPAPSCLTHLAYTPDGKRLASVAIDESIRVWDVDSGRELRRDRAGVFPAGLAFSPSGQRLALAEPEGLQIWDAPRTQEVLLFRERDVVTGVAFDAGSTRDAPGARLVFTGLADTARMYNVRSGREVRHFGGLGTLSTASHAVAYCCAFSPDDTRIAVGGGNATNLGTVALWDAEAGRKLDLVGHTNVVVTVAFSPNGQRLGSASHDHTARIWNVVTGEQLLSFSGHRDRVNGIAFHPDGKRVATGSHDKTVKIWDLMTGRELLTLSGHAYSVTSVAFSPDGKRLASASIPKDDAAGEVKIWDPATGKQLLALAGFEGGCYSVAFSPDGRMLAAAGEDRSVHIWDPENGRQLLVLRGHDGAIMRVAFSADSRLIASASQDWTVRVWDVSNLPNASEAAASGSAASLDLKGR
jgi:WD40 repeat protein